MPHPGSRAATAPERGNLALARQDERPLWLSKPGFLAFGTLRAYPLIQMRKLCVALAERALPLGRPEVQVGGAAHSWWGGKEAGESAENLLGWCGGEAGETSH